MNRREEYWTLISKLKDEPAALETSVQRAVKRGRRSRRLRSLNVFGGLAGACAAFVLMVNTAPAFAVSCGDIPVLKEIAAAVAWSPSLKQAIIHDYVQYVGQRQTADGVTVTLESVIADARQLVVFYRAEGLDGWHSMSCNLKDKNGNDLEAYSVTSGSSQDELNQFEIHFKDSAPPQDLILETQLHLTDELGQEGIHSNFTFTLHLNPRKTAQTIQLPVNQWVDVDGQRLLVERLELTPTKTALYLDDDSANTAWLRRLEFHFTDADGDRYDKTDSTISSTGRADSEGFYTYYHQSLYFLKNLKGLTLHITGADWLDKENHTVELDLTTGQADWLPDYIQKLAVKEENYAGSGPQKTLEITSANLGMCLEYTYYDPDGGEHHFNGGGMRRGYTDDQGVFHPHLFYYTLKDYPFDQVIVDLTYTHTSHLDVSIEIPAP